MYTGINWKYYQSCYRCMYSTTEWNSFKSIDSQPGCFWSTNLYSFFPFHIYNLLQASLDETQRFYYHALCLFHVFSNGNAILVITIDRFIGVSYPLRYGTLVTKRKTLQAIFMSWIMPVSFSVAFFTSLQKDSPGSSEFALRVYMIVSVVVVLVLYIMVYMAARKQRQKIRGMSNISDNAKTFMVGITVWKSTINTFFLVIFYVLTYLQFSVTIFDFPWTRNQNILRYQKEFMAGFFRYSL